MLEKNETGTSNPGFHKYYCLEQGQVKTTTPTEHCFKEKLLSK